MSEPTRVFVSYARRDGAEAAAEVQAELERNGFEVWRDVRDLDAFTDFSVEIERAIAALGRSRTTVRLVVSGFEDDEVGDE